MSPRPPRTPQRPRGARTTPAVQLEGVWYAYGTGTQDARGAEEELWALRDISLRIEQGELVCVVGANGSGKSTLMRVMDALVHPQRGCATIAGVATDGACSPALAAEVHRRCAMVFQNPDDQMVTSIVADDVAFGPENLGLPHIEIARRVDAALARTGMSNCAAMDPSDLSGGQRQRAAIAGALALQPELLLLDEATSMLDEQGRRDVLEIMAQLHEQSVTIVYTTQHMDEALHADRVIALDAGRIAFDGAPDALFEQGDLCSQLRLEAPFPFRLRAALKARVPRCADLPACRNMHELAHAVAVCLEVGHRVASPRACAAEAPAPATAHTAAPRSPGAAGIAPAIAFDDVSFSYASAPAHRRHVRRHRDQHPAHDAVHRLSFSAEPGTITALVGHTGSGKTTTAKLACGLIVPHAGSVRIAGIDTADATRRHELRARVGYVAQFPERQLFAATVFDDIAFGPRNLGLPEPAVSQRVAHALEVGGLAQSRLLLDRAPHDLSGGQQRAVALAGIIAMDCQTLVLDEPMAGLDPAGRARMRTLLAALKRAGTAIVFVTHDMDDAAMLADQVLVLSDGRIVARGTPRAVFTAPDAGTALPGIPQALAFSRLLTSAGAACRPDALTLDELVEEVARGAQG